MTVIVPQRLLRALALAAGPLLLAGEARACSKVEYLSHRAPTIVHFIGTAAADTALAGPGTLRVRVAPGHFGPAGERTVYGQVVEVERVGGLAAARLPAGATRVVRDYGADCTPTPWMRSARWVGPGTRGVFHATLRDPAEWADGLPTLDVLSPDLEPYPERLGRARGVVHPDSLLSVEQLFDVMDLLPPADESRVDAAAAAAPLLRWARANPELAARYPAAAMVRSAVYDIEHQQIRAIDPPLGGTYRFTATLGDGPPLTFHARSWARAVGGWNPSRRPSSSSDPTAVREHEGYSLLMVGADALESLPATCCGPDRRIRREAYMEVLRAPEPRPGPDGAQVWRGSIEVNLVARQFPAHEALGEFARAVGERGYQAYMQRQPVEVGATFHVLPDGSVRVEQTIELEDGRRLVLRGERVSRVTIPSSR